MATKKKGDETKQLQVGAELSQLSGRYANNVQISIQEEEFILDFFSRVGDQGTLVSRIFLSPTHAQRLVDLLKRQVARHKKTFGGGTSKRRRKKP